MSDSDRTDGGQPGEAPYETTPEEATGFGGPLAQENPGFFNRKKVLITLCIVLAAVAGGGLLMNLSRGRGGGGGADPSYSAAARAPNDFLRAELSRSMQNAPAAGGTASPAGEGGGPDFGGPDPGAQGAGLPAEFGGLPGASWTDGPAPAPRPASQAPPAPAGASGAGSTPASAAPAQGSPQTYYASPLTPRVEGSVFQASAAGAGQAPAAPAGAADEYLRYVMAQQAAPPQASPPAAAYSGYAAAQQSPDPYAAQNAQDNKQAFYGSGSGAAGTGYFIAPNTLWVGTVIPGILITGVNTDLPGNVTARVTENIYDSLTGRNLLIPQGTLLTARYNSSVSYAQGRVQIAWDSLIRPDGFMLDLGGMNGVDREGMSGQEARYDGHFFEYLKAAGLIALFTVANSRMAEEASKFAPEDSTEGIVQAGAEFVSQIGGDLVSRAMNIQPTLTVDPGTRINILLSQNLWLPSLDDYPVAGKYILER
jgi:type IV secretory pathway VirB10-like protein